MKAFYRFYRGVELAAHGTLDSVGVGCVTCMQHECPAGEAGTPV
jgi:hypothetical protein